MIDILFNYWIIDDFKIVFVNYIFVICKYDPVIVTSKYFTLFYIIIVYVLYNYIAWNYIASIIN